MQNIVEVACSSPPVVMNATKPAAQAVQVAEQDQFGLVLKKASERIVNDKQSDNVSNSRDSRTIDKSNGSESSAYSKVSENKNEKEIDKSNKADKSEKSINSEETEIKSDIEAKSDQETSVYGLASQTGTVVVNTVSATTVDSDTTGEIGEQAVQPGNLILNTSTPAVDEESVLSGNKAAKAQTTSAQATSSTSVVVNEETQEIQVEPEAKIEFTESLKKGAKVDEKTTTDLKPASGDSNVKASDGAKVNVSTSTNPNGEAVISIARNNQEVTLKTNVVAEKNVIPADVDPGQQNAPPGNPNGTTAVTANATVQNATQISEPARLAEAPKNEAITQVADQVSQMVKSNRTSVRMQLYPEELGHIDLRIVTTKNGIGVTMVADKASTQLALKSEMDLLRQSIEQAGIQLSNLNINQGHNSNRQQSFERRQNLSNSSYPATNSDNSNSTSNEPGVHLNSSVVDYRV
jgi:flagellar hook-length control protein FliK